jgi:ribosomal protein S27E
MKPGEDASECLRCGATTVRIGYGHAVYAVVCEECGLLVSPTEDAMTLHDAKELEWSE